MEREKQEGRRKVGWRGTEGREDKREDEERVMTLKPLNEVIRKS